MQLGGDRRSGRRAAVRAAAGGDDNDDLFSFLNEQMEKEEAEERGDEEGGSVITSAGEGDDDDAPEPGSPMSGEELRQLVFKKWGKMYDTRIHQRRDQFNKLGLYLQVMWKFVGQKSFPMTEAQYVEQLDAAGTPSIHLTLHAHAHTHTHTRAHTRAHTRTHVNKPPRLELDTVSSLSPPRCTGYSMINGGVYD